MAIARCEKTEETVEVDGPSLIAGAIAVSQDPRRRAEVIAKILQIKARCKECTGECGMNALEEHMVWAARR